MSGRDAVLGYATAKSQADVEGALRWCTDDVVIDTHPFQISGRGAPEVRSQLEGFFVLFPDYHVDLDGMIEQGSNIAGWGRVSATLSAPLGALQATGQSFCVPFACVWDIRDELIAREQFYFDLNSLCEQLGLDTASVAAVLTELRVHYERDSMSTSKA